MDIKIIKKIAALLVAFSLVNTLTVFAADGTSDCSETAKELCSDLCSTSRISVMCAICKMIGVNDINVCSYSRGSSDYHGEYDDVEWHSSTNEWCAYDALDLRWWLDNYYTDIGSNFDGAERILTYRESVSEKNIKYKMLMPKVAASYYDTVSWMLQCLGVTICAENSDKTKYDLKESFSNDTAKENYLSQFISIAEEKSLLKKDDEFYGKLGEDIDDNGLRILAERFLNCTAYKYYEIKSNDDDAMFGGKADLNAGGQGMFINADPDLKYIDICKKAYIQEPTIYISHNDNGDIQLKTSAKELAFNDDAKPYAEGNKVFVPLRVCAEQLGRGVIWNEKKACASVAATDINTIDTSGSYALGSDYSADSGVITFFGASVITSGSQIRITNGTMYVPIYYLAQGTYYKISSDNIIF